MHPKIRKRLRRALIVFVVIGAWWGVATHLERTRIATPLPAATTAAATPATAVDARALLADVRTLASPAFAGRRTGTAGSHQAREYLQARFAQVGLQPLGAGFSRPFSFTHHSLKGLLLPGRAWRTDYPDAANLLGMIPGTLQPQRVLVVSAHYDHLGERDGQLYPGADDNASGVAAMLAIARRFQAHPPRHTIVFAAFDAEELGLQGSRHFLQALPFPRGQLAANLNLDMVSHNDENALFIAGTRQWPAARPLVAGVAARHAVQVHLGHDRPLWRAAGVEDWSHASDHGAFADAGVPWLYAGVEDHPDYHAPSDTFAHINPAFFARASGLLVDLAATLDQALDPAPAAP